MVICCHISVIIIKDGGVLYGFLGSGRCHYCCCTYFVFCIILKKLRQSLKKMPINGILIVVITLLYFVNNYILKKHTIGFLNYYFICYFNDLICPLFFLSYVNMLLITIGKKITKLMCILFICVLTGVVWEFFAPFIKNSSTTDFCDIVCYILGGVLYYFIISIWSGEKK